METIWTTYNILNKLQSLNINSSDKAHSKACLINSKFIYSYNKAILIDLFLDMNWYNRLYK